jgi:hypothetical protein
MASDQQTSDKDAVIPELLYHVTLTVVDYHTDESGATRSIYPLGTFGSLKAAKSFAETGLEGLGYYQEDFDEFAAQSQMRDSWTHGDGIIVYARAPAGQVFVVGIDTTENTGRFPLAADGKTLVLPDGSNVLHYVMQTTINYNDDRTGSKQHTDIEGVYAHHADAQIAACKTLDAQDFADYHVRDIDGPVQDWPYGEDVFVHAVADDGRNCIVAVRTVPGAHQAHGKRSQGDED